MSATGFMAALLIVGACVWSWWKHRPAPKKAASSAPEPPKEPLPLTKNARIAALERRVAALEKAGQK